MVMEMVVGMVVGNPFFGGFRTILFLFYVFFRYRILFCMIPTYVDLFGEGFGLQYCVVGSSDVYFLRSPRGRW